jgi:uncharacterized protein DUF3147
MKLADPRKLNKVRWWEYAERFMLGFAISAAATVIGHVFGQKAGGAFLAFPATLPASLTLVDKKEGRAAAMNHSLGALFGGTGLIAFALSARASVNALHGWGVAVALLAWAAVAFGGYVIFARRTEGTEERRTPHVGPTIPR